MRKFSILSITILLFGLNVKAHTKALKKFVQKIDQYKNISYTSFINNETPFGDSEDTVQAYLTKNYGKDKTGKFLFKTSQQKDIFNGEVLLNLYLKNKTYSVNQDYRFSPYYYNSLTELISTIKNTLHIASQQIKELADTAIKNITCYHIKIITLDTVINKKHAYTVYHIYFNKKNYLPVYAENRQQGYMEKNGVLSDDVFQLTKRNTFSNYKFNSPNFPDIETEKVPLDFRLANTESSESKPLLSPGIQAPDWKLQDTNGKFLSMDDLKDNVVLIDFSANYCAACILSMPALDRLPERYKNENVKFVTINMGDSKESVLKFIRKYNVKYPIYINGKEVSEKYNVTAIPVFYLIDKKGNIVATFDGYSEMLEKKVIQQIDSIKRL